MPDLPRRSATTIGRMDEVVDQVLAFRDLNAETTRLGHVRQSGHP
jgi:hypothetical protein